MSMTLSRSVRFARSLALAGTLALPACSSAEDDGKIDAPKTNPSTAPAPAAPATATRDMSAGPATTAPPTTDAGVAAATDAEAPDAGGRISGPLPPPELPASFA